MENNQNKTEFVYYLNERNIVKLRCVIKTCIAINKFICIIHLQHFLHAEYHKEKV